MSQPRVTVVVTPREQFRVAQPALARLRAETTLPHRLVYVDGRSPGPIRRHLAELARRRDFLLLRSDHYLAPNEARTLALPHLEGEYVCFIDNDVLVTPGWLEALVACADETGAAAVGPLYCNGRPEQGLVHMAGGQAHITEQGGRRAFFEEHYLAGRRLEEVRAPLGRGPTELVEYHCMLLRTDVYRRFAPQDPRYLSSAEALDICLALRGAGQGVYLEPASRVANIEPPPFEWSGLPYFLLRWSDAWNRISLRCFRERWELPADDAWVGEHYAWLTGHRHLAWGWLAERTRRALGWRRGGWLARRIVDAIEGRVARADLRRRGLTACGHESPAPAPRRPAVAAT